MPRKETLECSLFCIKLFGQAKEHITTTVLALDLSTVFARSSSTPSYPSCIYTARCSSAALKFYRRTDDVSADMEEMDTEHQGEKETAANTYTLNQILRAKDLRMPLIIICGLQIVQQFSGINAVSIRGSWVPHPRRDTYMHIHC